MKIRHIEDIRKKDRRAGSPAGEHYFFFVAFFLAVAFVPHFFPQAIDVTSSNKYREQDHCARDNTFYCCSN
jgi:hypothetical protein